MWYNDLFHSCLWIARDGGWLQPLRFTPERLKAYSASGDKPYSRCPAGVTLRFTSELPEIRICFKVHAVLYGSTVWDVYENGTYLDSFDFGAEVGEKSFVFRRRQKGTSLIEIYFPVASEISVAEASLKGLAPCPPAHGTPRLLVLGDSISQGLMGKHPSLAHVPLICRLLGWEVLNVSVGGDRYDPDWLDEGIYEPDRILLALGTNDYAFEPDIALIESRANAYCAKLRTIYPGIPITAVSPPWFVDFGDTRIHPLPRHFADVRRVITQAALANGFQWIDGDTLLPHSAEFYEDHAHPNDLGFSQYALNLLKQTGWASNHGATNAMA